MAARLRARFLCVHVLQTVPLSNLNRDDTNSVKTVQYGGVLRTRVSSQCWKRATRRYFEERTGQSALRTRRLAERIARELTEQRGWEPGLAARAGAHVAAAAGIKFEVAAGEDNKPVANMVQLNALVYIPDTAAAELADLAEEFRGTFENAKDITKAADKSVLKDHTDRVKDVLRSRNDVINTFGRMLAEVDDAGVDGAVQVAHAMTTHPTDVEIDYFSAVDDVTALWKDATGSGHMGHAELSAGTFYRYATIDLDELASNLGGDLSAARDLAVAFVESFVRSLPQAKKNSTAPNTPPDLVHLTVRSDRPLSLAAAFEKPVRMAAEGGFATASRDELARYAEAVNEFMGAEHILLAGWSGLEAKDLNGLGERHRSLGALVSAGAECAFAAAGAEAAA